MRCLLYLPIFLTVLILLGFAPSAFARGPVAREKGNLDQTASLADIIAAAGANNVHILHVHGMRATRPGLSEPLRKALVRRYDLPRSDKPIASERLNLPKPKEAWVGQIRYWETDAEWKGSLPFIDRYEFQPQGGGTITIHEVNWWPLLFPLKCRELMLREHDLAGDDRKLIELCARSDEPYHPWISKEQRDWMLRSRPKSGGGARANAYLKRQFVDWGFADAVIALGPMREIIRAAMDAAFAKADADMHGSGTVIVVAESLGSFVVLDTYSKGSGGVRELLNRSDYLYFFANQVALLQLGRMRLVLNNGKPIEAEPTPLDQAGEPDAGGQSAVEALNAWAKVRAAERERRTFAVERIGLPTQVVTFNDPSDALTFDLPCIDEVSTVNLYVRNGWSWFGLFAFPGPAHQGGLSNPGLWRWMLKKKDKPPAGKPRCDDPARGSPR